MKETAEIIEKIRGLKNAINLPEYDLDKYDTFKVNIKIDNSVANAMFRQDPKDPKTYFTNTQTFRAMKKNIFECDPDEVLFPYTCESCKFELDQQFWNFCPKCGEAFKAD